MKILVTNDDGIANPNLKVLVEVLIKQYPNSNIIVVAPKNEQSAVSHRIEIKNEVVIQKEKDIIEGISTYSVNSTPSDCVIYTNRSLKYDFDIVFSGVNNGFNMGIDILYSGTVAAAVEAMNYCHRAVALSCQFYSIEDFLNNQEKFFHFYKSHDFENMCLNVNFPKVAEGIKITSQNIFDNNSLTLKDTEACSNNFISVTPLKMDSTNYEHLEKINKMIS